MKARFFLCVALLAIFVSAVPMTAQARPMDAGQTVTRSPAAFFAGISFNPMAWIKQILWGMETPTPALVVENPTPNGDPKPPVKPPDPPKDPPTVEEITWSELKSRYR